MTVIISNISTIINHIPAMPIINYFITIIVNTIEFFIISLGINAYFPRIGPNIALNIRVSIINPCINNSYDYII